MSKPSQILAASLKTIGAVSLIAFGAAGTAAWLAVKERVQITIEQPADASQPEPMALLRDDVEQLHQGQGQLVTALQQSLSEIGAALERAAGEREQLAAGLRTLRERPVGAPQEFVPPALQEGETSSATSPAETVPPERSFLSFSLPATSLPFDARQRYRIIPSLSRVGFDARSTLHDFSGVTEDVEGEVSANLGRPEEPWMGEIRCRSATLDSGNGERDAGMRERIAAAEHEFISFAVSGFVPAANGVDVDSSTLNGEALGKLTIRGVARDVRIPVAIALDESRRIAVSGQARVHLPDFDIAVPNKLGLITMDEDVTIWLELRARSLGAALSEAGGR